MLKVGFRYDAANLRWVRDKRQDGRVFDMSKALIKPFSGEAYMSWPVCHGLLTEAGLRSVSPKEARRLQRDRGWALVDVRLSDAYEAERAEGAVSAPLFRYLDERPQEDGGGGKSSRLSVADLAKKLAMAAFAMRATERVPRWAQEAFPFEAPKERAGKLGFPDLGALLASLGGGGGSSKSDARPSSSSSTRSSPRPPGVLLMCSVGGSMNTVVKFRRGEFADPERSFGRESRSLKAAYELLQDPSLGWSADNVVHVEGGLAQWRFEGLPIEVAGGAEVVGAEAEALAAEEAGLDEAEVRRRRRRRQRQRAGGMIGF
jgi:rhodanese-related sulfurtransferase